jgi:hypothetical protein
MSSGRASRQKGDSTERAIVRLLRGIWIRSRPRGAEMTAPVNVVIEHAITADMDNGRPLPPLIVDGVVWRVVRRLPGGRT